MCDIWSLNSSKLWTARLYNQEIYYLNNAPQDLNLKFCFLLDWLLYLG